jgi:hypothetical protein
LLEYNFTSGEQRLADFQSRSVLEDKKLHFWLIFQLLEARWIFWTNFLNVALGMIFSGQFCFPAGQKRQIFKKSHQAFPPIIGGPPLMWRGMHAVEKGGNVARVPLAALL